MKLIGYILLGLGALLMLISFGTDTAPGGTHNIGLMQSQLMLFQTGALSLLIGAISSAITVALGRMEAAGILPPTGVKAPGSRLAE